MREDSKHELYQTCEMTHCCLTRSSGIQYDYLSMDEAKDMERAGLIMQKWPQDKNVNWWILRSNV